MTLRSLDALRLLGFEEEAVEEGAVGDVGGADLRADASPHHVVVTLFYRKQGTHIFLQEFLSFFYSTFHKAGYAL